MNELLKIGGGATGPGWHINWWVLSVWAWELGVWKEEFRVFLPYGCAVSEAEQCDDNGTGWVTPVLCDLGHILHLDTLSLLTGVK